MSLILGVESSCDDTAIAIVNDQRQILASIVINQNNIHQEFKGVVPEIAARNHLTNLEIAFNKAITESNININNIDAIAATCGPGLIGGVLTGAVFAKALSFSLNKPFIAINHLEGHALTVRLTDNIQFPYLLFLMSGGHSQIIIIHAHQHYQVIGETLDDAIGEAFDKVAKMLNLAFPGGPELEKLAKLGNSQRFKFPLSMINSGDCKMSFSGLKTAVRREIEKLIIEGEVSNQDKADIAASFQLTIAQIIAAKLKQAFAIFNQYNYKKQIVIAGGVAANNCIRQTIINIANKNNFEFIFPEPKLCTDNAAMIAWAGMERFKKNETSDLNFCPKPRWPLEELNT